MDVGKLTTTGAEPSLVDQLKQAQPAAQVARAARAAAQQQAAGAEPADTTVIKPLKPTPQLTDVSLPSPPRRPTPPGGPTHQPAPRPSRPPGADDWCATGDPAAEARIEAHQREHGPTLFVEGGTNQVHVMTKDSRQMTFGNVYAKEDVHGNVTLTDKQGTPLTAAELAVFDYLTGQRQTEPGSDGHYHLIDSTGHDITLEETLDITYKLSVEKP